MMNNLSIRKMNEMTKKKKKGFTLIELIIVIAIIAIIAAIAIPKFGQVKENANIASDQANAKIIATAVAQAVSDGKSGTDAVNPDVYKNYLDGGTVPKVKSASATGFNVTYDKDIITKGDDGKDVTTKGIGTVVTLEGSGLQVYPVK